MGAWLRVVFLSSLVDNYDYPSGFLDPLTAPGWVFYGAHQVSITRTVTRSGRTQSTQLDVFGPPAVSDGLTTTVSGLLYHLVPVVVLLGAGYLVLAVVGRSLFEASASGAQLARLRTVGGGIDQITALPTLTGSVLMVGLVYPLVFGTVGTLLGTPNFFEPA